MTRDAPAIRTLTLDSYGRERIGSCIIFIFVQGGRYITQSVSLHRCEEILMRLLHMVGRLVRRLDTR